MSHLPPQIPPIDPNKQHSPSGVAGSTGSIGLTSDDVSHLGTLSVCWKIMAILNAFTPCCLFGYLSFLTAGVGAAAASGEAGGGVAALAGGMIMVICIPLLMLMIGVAWLFWNASTWLTQPRNMTWLTVASTLAILSGPIGIALGVFTLVVINRPSVRAAMGP